MPSSRLCPILFVQLLRGSALTSSSQISTSRWLWCWRPGVFILLALSLATTCGRLEEPHPEDVLAQAREALETVRTVHFSLNIDGGGLELLPGVLATEIEGEVLRPDRLAARVRATARGMPINLEFRAVGDRQWVSNPLIPGQWQQLPSRPVTDALLDPQAGLATLMADMTDLDLGSTEQIDGIRAHHVTGHTPNSSVAAYLGGEPLGGTTVIELWVAVDDSRLFRAVLTGPAVAGDGPDIVRRLNFYDFGASIEISAPAQ